jgi:POT family proton-dependent oligopeptide transporter
MARCSCGVLGTSSLLGFDCPVAYVGPPVPRLQATMPLLNTICAENYMEQPLRHDTRQIPGALGPGQAVATRIYCAFYLFYYVTPIFVAIVADSHLGRYVTLVVSTILYGLGCLGLTASSMPSNLEHGWGIPGLAVAMVLVGLGGGGFRATIVPFIVDQQAWTEPRLITLNTGEVVVTDYQLTLQYICNLYYWSVRTLCPG